MAMTMAQRRRAQRLRERRDEPAKRKPLTAREVEWLDWYDKAVQPSPIPTAAEAPDEAAELEELAAELEAEPEEAPAELEPAPAPHPVIQYVTAPPRAPGVSRVTRSDGSVEERTVQKLYVEECTNEALRSAVNAQIAALEMMERATRIALDMAAAASSQVSGLVQQLVDTHTALAEAQQERVVATHQAQVAVQAAQASAGGDGSAVGEEIGKRIIDQVFPPAAAPAAQEPNT